MATNNDETQTPATSVETPTATAPDEEREPARRAVLRLIRPAIVMTLALTIITGLIYPGIITGLGQLFFPSQANGSLLYVNGKPVASSLIGQYWTQTQYFHGRPSATNNPQGTPAPYSADNSGASNLGPTNQTLITTVQQRIDELKKENPDVPAGTP
ncbi:MAG TPA: potassium-transporting ATPase subunit C, partial [Ktedonobacterales bacterium]